MMRLQLFLIDGGTLELLESQYNVATKRHGKYPNLVLFKYGIDSPMGELLVQECRGVILDESDTWNVVARPFDKFFNHGEEHAAQIDWEQAVVQEKLDGSLCTLYHYKDEWHVATSGTPDASGEVNGFGISFATLFWQTYDEQFGRDTLCSLRKDRSYMFELTSPMNRIVVKHEKPKLTLLSVRATDSGLEWLPDILNPVRAYSLSSLEDVIVTFQSMSPLEQEGYVIIGGRSARGGFDRVKVKHPGYVALHQFKDSMSPRRLVEIAQQGEVSEVIAHFPEWAEKLTQVSARFNALAAKLEADYERIKHIPEQKAFALEALKTVNSAALFAVRKGQVPNVRKYLQQMESWRLMDLLDREMP